MQYIEPIGPQGSANAFGRDYVDKNAGAGIAGSFLSAKVPEHLQIELLHLIAKSGLTPSAALTQVAQAVRSGRLNYRAATGTANALSITLDPAPADWSEITAGMALNIGIGATNTAGATLAIAGLSGTRPILRPGGAALVAGDLGSGSVVRLIYDGSAFQMAGLTQQSGRTTVVYATAGVYSWTCPAGVFRVRAMVWAAGGGGGGAAGAANSIASSGGGGEYREGSFSVTPGVAYTIVVGAAGSFGISTGPTNGGVGGTSSFDSFMSAIGGGGGVAANGAIQNTAGAGGSGGSGGQIARPGLGGGIAFPIPTGFVLGQGGPAYSGNFTPTITTGGIANGAPGIFPGGGGQGGALGGSGGAGASGQVILEF